MMIYRIFQRTGSQLGCKIYREAALFHKSVIFNHSNEAKEEMSGRGSVSRYPEPRSETINDSISEDRGRNDPESDRFKNDKLENFNLQEFEKYVLMPTRTIDELLTIDVRPLPPLVRLTCLEAVLSAARRDQLRATNLTRSVPPERTRSKVTSDDNWLSKYLAIEHASRWTDWDIGINPCLDLNPSAPKPTWLNSQKFELLVLTTAASANRLPIQQLLSLAGHLRYLWTHFDPVVYASVLRLLNSQINELGLIDILRVNSMIRDLPSECYVIPTAQIVPDFVQPEHSLSSLMKEADLLRSAIRAHLLSKLLGMESMDVVLLLRMLEDLNPTLTMDERLKILNRIDLSMIVNPEQKNLYTMIFIFTRLSLLGAYTRSILNRCCSQLRRKLYLAHRFPGNDQTRYLAAVVLALANLTVGAPQQHARVDPVTSPDCLFLFTQPPVMPVPPVNPAKQPHRGVDVGSFVRADWIQQLFTEITGYVATARSANSPVGSPRVHHVQLQAEVAYGLALLGYRANSILDQLRDQSDSLQLPLLEMSELLVSPTLPSGANEINLDVVRRLPRIDWQFYYHLASEVLSSSSPKETDSLVLLSNYVALKKAWVDTFVEHLRSRLSLTNPLEIATFHRISYPSGPEHSYFADIIFKLKSLQSPDTTKVVMCFLCCGRDQVVKRPLDTLMNAYRGAAEQTPCITFDYTQWSHLDKIGRRERCDLFLKELLQIMINSRGIPTDGIQLWTDTTD